MKHRSWIEKTFSLALTSALLGLSACTAAAPQDAAPATGDQPTADSAAPAATVAVEPTAVADVTGVVTDTAAMTDTMRPGMHQGARMGAMHQRMQDAMHQAMLDEAQTQGLITAEDAALFLKVHTAIDPYRPAQMGLGMNLSDDTRKAMQRSYVAQAVTAGTITQAEADRFTEIHDLLIDEGIMARFDSEEGAVESAATATPGS